MTRAYRIVSKTRTQNDETHIYVNASESYNGSACRKILLV